MDIISTGKKRICKHLIEIKYFCVTDQLFLCEFCIEDGHENHKLLDHSEILTSFSRTLTSTSNKIKTTEVLQAQCPIQLERRLKLSIGGVIKEIRAQFDECIENFSKGLTTEVEKLTLTLHHGLGADAMYLKDLKKKLREQIRDIKNFRIKEGNLVKIVNEFCRLEADQKRIEVIEARIAETKTIEADRKLFDIPKYCASVIDKFLRNTSATFKTINGVIRNEIASISSTDSKRQNIYTPERVYYTLKDTLIIADVQNFKKYKYPHSAEGVDLDSNSIYASSGNFFLTGGSKLFPHNWTYEFDFKKKEMQTRAQMKQGRWGHALVELKYNTILAIGGRFTNNQHLCQCEAYTIDRDSWKKIALLNTERYCAVAFCFDEKFVYVYGGYNGKENVNTLESIELSEDLVGAWKNVYVTHSLLRQPCQSVGCLAISPREILIFGGRDNDGKLTKECALLNLEEMVMKKTDCRLENTETFYRISRGYYQGKYYYLSYAGQFHIFDGEKWSLGLSIGMK